MTREEENVKRGRKETKRKKSGTDANLPDGHHVERREKKERLNFYKYIVRTDATKQDP